VALANPGHVLAHRSICLAGDKKDQKPLTRE